MSDEQRPISIVREYLERIEVIEANISDMNTPRLQRVRAALADLDRLERLVNDMVGWLDAARTERDALVAGAEWEDVPREEPFNAQGDYVMGTGEGLCVWLQCTVAGAIWHGVPLGENMRLQRRVPTSEVTP